MSSSTSWNQATANGSVSLVPSWTREPTLADQLQLQLQQAEMQPELKNPDATEDRSQPTRTVQLPLKSRGKHCAIGNISCVCVVGQNNVGNIFLQLDSDLQNNALNSGVPEWVRDPLWRRHADMRHGQLLAMVLWQKRFQSDLECLQGYWNKMSLHGWHIEGDMDGMWIAITLRSGMTPAPDHVDLGCEMDLHEGQTKQTWQADGWNEGASSFNLPIVARVTFFFH